eukprot:TRINITY_DN3517_c0_g1_i4.p1 TRINITY_DN3517_c0_g1~~TRINITY_DN3517_c0_g1_i4.p1  ORF type:complete len:742 (+),score=274.67 TRINITY_DN3517_c0_g1_i4:83-2308(+)
MKKFVVKFCSAFLMASMAFGQTAIIGNGNLVLGVDKFGQLNIPYRSVPSLGLPTVNPFNTASIGIRSTNPSQNSTIATEGWGVKYTATTVALILPVVNTYKAYVDNSRSIGGVIFESFTGVDGGTTAKSVTRISGGARITHDFGPTSDPNVYKVAITVENPSSFPYGSFIYRRQVDWSADQPYVTIKGAEGHPAVACSCDDGKLGGNIDVQTCVLGVNSHDITDSGPADHGAYFDFQIGPIAARSSKTFNMYYGGALNFSALDESYGKFPVEVVSYAKTNCLGLPGDNKFVLGIGFCSLGGPVLCPKTSSTFKLSSTSTISPSTYRSTLTSQTSQATSQTSQVTSQTSQASTSTVVVPPTLPPPSTCNSPVGLCNYSLPGTCNLGIPKFPILGMDWSDFNLISFNSFTCSGGDIEGRLAVRNRVQLSGYSVGLQLEKTTQSWKSHSLVVGGDASWTEGSLHPDGSVSGVPKSYAYVGGSNNFPTYLSSRIVNPAEVSADKMKQSFDEAKNFYLNVQQRLASMPINAVASVKYTDGLEIQCAGKSDFYHVSIPGQIYNSIHWVGLVNCSLTAQWAVDITGDVDIIMSGAPFPAISERVVFNILGNPRKVRINTGLSGHLLAPLHTFDMTNGVTYGTVIAGDVTFSRQNNIPDCINVKPVTIVTPVIMPVNPGDTSVCVPGIDVPAGNDTMVCMALECQCVTRCDLIDVDLDGILDHVLHLGGALSIRANLGTLLSIRIGLGL